MLKECTIIHTQLQGKFREYYKKIHEEVMVWEGKDLIARGIIVIYKNAPAGTLAEWMPVGNRV